MRDLARSRQASGGLSVAEVLAWLRELGRHALLRKGHVAMSAAQTMGESYAGARATLDHLRHLPWNWDGEGAPQPSKHAADRADIALGMLARADVPTPKVFGRPDGGFVLSWRSVTKHGVLEIEARIGDEGDQVQAGYAHEPGFHVDENVDDVTKLAGRVRDIFQASDR